MLTRIYGTAFFSKKDLDLHLERIEEARPATIAARSSARPLHAAQGGAGMPFWLATHQPLLR